MTFARTFHLLRSLVIPLAAAATALGAGAGRAAADAYELSAGVTRRALHAGSADAITENGLTSGSLDAARRLPFTLPAGLVLAAELGFEAGTVRGTLFQSIDTETSRVALDAGVRAHLPLWRALAATARAGAGMARTSLRLSPSWGSGPASLADAGWSPELTATAGLEAAVQIGGQSTGFPRARLGVRLELGYALAAAEDLAPGPESPAPDGTLQIPREQASLGALDLGGWTFGLAGLVRF
jgi:hypothetical protein